MDGSRLGRMLTLYRASRRLTTRGCAAEIGVSPATVSRVERGHQPDLATWRRFEEWMLAEEAPARHAAPALPMQDGGAR